MRGEGGKMLRDGQVSVEKDAQIVSTMCVWSLPVLGRMEIWVSKD